MHTKLKTFTHIDIKSWICFSGNRKYSLWAEAQRYSLAYMVYCQTHIAFFFFFSHIAFYFPVSLPDLKLAFQKKSKTFNEGTTRPHGNLISYYSRKIYFFGTFGEIVKINQTEFSEKCNCVFPSQLCQYSASNYLLSVSLRLLNSGDQSP